MSKREELARLLFEELKPSNPHGSQSDLYLGMPYCDYQTKQAYKLADQLLEKYRFAEENPTYRRYVAEAREAVLDSLEAPENSALTLTAGSIDQLLKLALAVENLLPPEDPFTVNPAQPLLDAINGLRAAIARGERPALKLDTQGNPFYEAESLDHLGDPPPSAAPVVAEELTLEEWVNQLERQLSRTMPDMYPEGYALQLAEHYADTGGYDDYLAGKFPAGVLWAPTT